MDKQAKTDGLDVHKSRLSAIGKVFMAFSSIPLITTIQNISNILETHTLSSEWNCWCSFFGVLFVLMLGFGIALQFASHLFVPTRNIDIRDQDEADAPQQHDKVPYGLNKNKGKNISANL